MKKLNNEQLAKAFNGHSVSPEDVKSMVSEIMSFRGKSLAIRGYEMFRLQEALHQTRVRAGILGRVINILWEAARPQNHLTVVEALDWFQKTGEKVSLERNINHQDAIDYLKKKTFGIQRSKSLKEEAGVGATNKTAAN